MEELSVQSSQVKSGRDKSSQQETSQVSKRQVKSGRDKWDRQQYKRREENRRVYWNNKSESTVQHQSSVRSVILILQSTITFKFAYYDFSNTTVVPYRCTEVVTFHSEITRYCHTLAIFYSLSLINFIPHEHHFPSRIDCHLQYQKRARSQCMYIHMHIHVQIYRFMYIYVSVYAYIYTCIYMYRYTDTCTDIQMYAYLCICVCICLTHRFLHIGSKWVFNTEHSVQRQVALNFL